MCGLLCVRSTKPIALEQHLEALHLLADRGPDLTTYDYRGTIFIGQTVLNFSGDIEYYQEAPGPGRCVFNGEIYNHARWSAQGDARLVHQTVSRADWGLLREMEGPWAWIYTDWQDIYFASDPQHERHLFFYHDDDLWIIASELACILHYLGPDAQKCLVDSTVKHLPVLDHANWQGIQRARPGWLYKNMQQQQCIDDIRSWPRQTFTGSYQQALEQLDAALAQVAQDMTTISQAITASGGLDSGLLLEYFPRAAPYTSCMDKDPVSKTVDFGTRIEIGLDRWADSFRKVTSRLHHPVMSWNMISLDALLDSIEERAVIVGTGADELFGGYPYNLDGGPSPYSGRMFPNIDRLTADYIVQSGGVDLMGADIVAGWHGKEMRAPFAHPRIIRLALSLPYDFKVGSDTKRILRDLYRIKTGRAYSLPKQGFTGHCNDCIPQLDPHFARSSGDRLTEWREFVLHWFAHHA